MAQRLKSWESPRRQGRNQKGKGGSARARQLRKRQQTLRNQLKAQAQQEGKEGNSSFPFFDPVFLPNSETSDLFRSIL
ncbi:MAG: hypothetical protein ACRC8A_17610 [Microcoleaceae cyanobacterium]